MKREAPTGATDRNKGNAADDSRAAFPLYPANNNRIVYSGFTL
jgi:hypothetical protein